MPRSIHDNNIYGFMVYCDGQQIILHTEYTDGLTPEYTDIKFTGVVAHHFNSILKGNILFDIGEIDPATILQRWPDLFANEKKYGWPDIKYDNPQELLAILKQRGIKGFEVNSSYGLNGWVLALSMEIIERTTKKDFD